MTSQSNIDNSIQIIIFDRWGNITASLPEMESARRLENLSSGAVHLLDAVNDTLSMCRIYLPTVPREELCHSVLLRGAKGFSGMYVLVSDLLDIDRALEQWSRGTTCVLSLPLRDESMLSPLVSSVLEVCRLEREHRPDARQLCAAMARAMGIELEIMPCDDPPTALDRYPELARCLLRPDAALLSVQLLLTFMAIRVCGGDRAVLHSASRAHRVELELPGLDRSTVLRSEIFARCCQLADIYDTLYMFRSNGSDGLFLTINATLHDSSVLGIKAPIIFKYDDQ